MKIALILNVPDEWKNFSEGYQLFKYMMRNANVREQYISEIAKLIIKAIHSPNFVLEGQRDTANPPE